MAMEIIKKKITATIRNFLPKKYILILLLWFIDLFVIGYVGFLVVPHTGVNQDYGFPHTWSNWDGNNYLSIAKNGYQATGNYSFAFFPLYPLLIAGFSHLVSFPFFVAWFISIFSFISSIILLRKIILLDFSEKIAQSAFFLLLLFPTSFFFFATYTESLFLLFVLASIYSFRKEKYVLSAVLAAGASATRLAGLGLIFFFAYEMRLLEAKPLGNSTMRHPEPAEGSIVSKKRHLGLRYVPIIGTIIGTAAYMLYLYLTKNDPFYFFTVQRTEFHRAALVFPLQTVVAIPIKWLINRENVFAQWFTGIMFAEIVCSLIFLKLLILGFFKKIRVSYLLFALFAWSLPLVTGIPSSMLRYVLVLFPGFITLAVLLEDKRILRLVVYMFLAIGLIFATMYFHSGHWIG